MKVDQYIEALIAREGGYVDHPADRGGPTTWGITEQVARAYGYHGRMQDLPRSEAKAIYLERYWEAPRFHQVNDLSAAVAEELLDTGVNMGTGVAARFLQRALNVLNQEGKHYLDIVVDGAIGRMTLAALRAYLGARGKDGHVVLLRALNAQQGVRYIELAEGRPSQEAFVHGWLLHRVA
ncbi:glycoside hydrolase family 108 protein [Quisquiliibacterium transsilvanicum]|uniref:Lysozyme family protein n=1 Tax=Quisquiliibacterium transsilvanicum TaxID=1549638 RepID=A0A7W8M886_9BURK|nr:glycoside hydrolase family 108 protein [Quisquiliibacterium transsilvanicum]MBB5271558.1 lysozyme family protein [Quisquiliibacterium transsilvanicum]